MYETNGNGCPTHGRLPSALNGLCAGCRNAEANKRQLENGNRPGDASAQERLRRLEKLCERLDRKYPIYNSKGVQLRHRPFDRAISNYSGRLLGRVDQFGRGYARIVRSADVILTPWHDDFEDATEHHVRIAFRRCSEFAPIEYSCALDADDNPIDG